MSPKSAKFTIVFADDDKLAREFDTDSILIGRLEDCDVVLDHNSVSRIHAKITYRDSKYSLINLSSSNVLTINGRQLGPQERDVLAGGDMLQIGPFALLVSSSGNGITLTIDRPISEETAERLANFDPEFQDPLEGRVLKTGKVLSVFWDKRTREDKDHSAGRSRPTGPIPGKSTFNWKPTQDLVRTWPRGLRVFPFLIVAAIGLFVYSRYPAVYSQKPLSNPHSSIVENSLIANASSGTSCTTCHTPNAPIETSCNDCHRAQEFYISNTKAHEEAGITCTVCHREHQGTDHDLTATAIQSCASCHNDNNSTLYNEKGVRTPHDGSYGYPVVDGEWKWKGVDLEVAASIPEINDSATGDKDDQARLSRHFHTVHLGRLKAPGGLASDERGFVSCSSCHKSQDPVDRTTPRRTCAACHTTPADATGRDTRFGTSAANCISCHTQHPYSAGRWREFLSDDAFQRRKDAVAEQIKQLRDR